MEKFIEFKEFKNASYDEIYEYYNTLSVEQLFEKKIYIEYLELETTNFDVLTNMLYFRNYEYWKKYKHYVEDHIAHEYEIIHILSKFKQNPRDIDEIKSIIASQVDRKYPYGKYFLEGNTGLMSSLLVNCLYIVYEYLLKMGVEVNGTDDSLIIFFKLTKTNMTLIPQDELDSINNIFKIFKKNKKLKNILLQLHDFNKQYKKWTDPIIIKEWYKYKYEHYINLYKPNSFYDIMSIIQNPQIYKFIEDYVNSDLSIYKKKFPDIRYSIYWEYSPEYDNYNNNATPEFINKIVNGLLNSNL